MSMKRIEYGAKKEQCGCLGRNGFFKSIAVEVWAAAGRPGLATIQPVTSKNQPQNAMMILPLKTLVQLGEWALRELELPTTADMAGDLIEEYCDQKRYADNDEDRATAQRKIDWMIETQKMVLYD